VAVIPSSGLIVVGDHSNHRIRLVTPLGVVTTLAGSNIAFADGTGTGASFIFPQGVAVDPFTDRVYVADTYNQRIRQITLPYS
jgi:sugar lactone lactonase YvrE